LHLRNPGERNGDGRRRLHLRPGHECAHRHPETEFGLGWAGGVVARAGAPAAGPSLRETMRFKLHYAQGVLESSATGNFPLVAAR
jgi:hypothetical protein